MTSCPEILPGSDKSAQIWTDAEMARFGFVPIRLELVRIGGVYDIATPGLAEGSSSFWHVTVTSEPYYSKVAKRNRGGEWLDFAVTDGLFAMSLAHCPAYIREVA